MSSNPDTGHVFLKFRTSLESHLCDDNTDPGPSEMVTGFLEAEEGEVPGPTVTPGQGTMVAL